MTEEEAKTRWCPHSRISADPLYERDGFPKGAYTASEVNLGRCIASACMMWRQKTYLGDGKGWSGFCGLAGKP